MTKSRGMSLLPIPLTLAAVVGLTFGLGAYAFHYAKGSSYIGNDPATCANCHVMQHHLDGWQAAPHHAVATCNDCHLPASGVAKYAVKAENGMHHSSAFVSNEFPDVIMARPQSKEVVDAACRRCHASMVEGIEHSGGAPCVRCHASVGHLR